MKEYSKTGFYEIKDKIFYHLFSYEKIKAGKIIETKSSKNGMWKRVYQNDYALNGQNTHSLINKVSKRKIFSFMGKEKLKKLSSIINNYDFALRELALESVRAEKFKKYPSRFSCIFVVESEKEALDWTSRLLWQRPNCQLVKLKCSGKVFVGDSKFNKKDNFSYEKSLQIAEGFWSGKESKTPQLELLFEGKAEIMEVIKELN